MHTLVIGTSKSKNEDAYYIKAKEKFWLSLHISGFTERQYEPEDYRELMKKGVGFAELAFHHQFIGENECDQPFTQDKQLVDDLEVIRKGIPDLINYIQHTKVKTLVFNGKTALSCFLEFDKRGKVEALNSGFLKEKKYAYGKCCQWKGHDVYLMPNLSAAAGIEWKTNNGLEHWIKLWKDLSSQNNHSGNAHKELQVSSKMHMKSQLSPQQKIFLGLFLFVFSTIMMLIYILLTKNIIIK